MGADNKREKADAEQEAIRLLAQRHLHRCMWIPQTASHDRLRVTFSTTSNFDDGALPAVLLVMPMFGSRYMATSLDRLSIDCGVRVIFIERPGFGGSTTVPLSKRVATWIETVPFVLEKLGVKHVSLVSHSAGTMYSLNTLAQLRSVLDPVAPYAAYLGPFVESASSQATLTRFLSTLPAGLVGTWENLARFINLRIMPMGSWSGGIFSSAAAWLENLTDSPDVSASAAAENHYGVGKAVAKEIDRLKTIYVFAEECTGVNDEALLCLKKGEPGLWASAEDYVQFVKALQITEQTRLQEEPSSAKLKVRCFFGETDVMIGEGGRKYFQEVWEQEGVANVIDFKSTICKGTDHETVLMDLEHGGLATVFKEIRGLSTS